MQARGVHHSMAWHEEPQAAAERTFFLLLLFSELFFPTDNIT
jgi:hypothetical protein